MLAVGIPLCLVVLLIQQVDNDTWFVLAEGREITQNGFYYEDVLSMHEGLAVTVQNYGFAVISWWIFSIFGMAGIYMMMIVLFLLMIFFVYKICMLISNKNENLSLILASVTGSLMTMGFITTRGQMVEYVVILALIYVLELFVKTNKGKYLAWIPVLSLILINMRAATWLMIFLIMLTYVIDGIRKPKLHLQGYRIWPILVAGAVAMTVGLFNPYGVKMMTFVFTSFGNSEIMNLVNEMKTFDPGLGTNFYYYAGIVAVITGYAFGNKKNVRVRYLLMFFGFLFLGLMSIKGMAELIIVMFFPMALHYKDWKMPVLINHAGARRMTVIWSGVVTGAVAVTGLISVLCLIEAEPRASLVEAVNKIDEGVEEGGRKGARVYVGYDDGGYLEFRGYRPYLDPRAEVFIKKNNGKEDILKEWEDLENGNLSVEKFIEKYDFDYMLVREDDKIYDLEDENYELVYDDEDRLYKKV